jgi:tetratricopeptide (TPR) repeat protein
MSTSNTNCLNPSEIAREEILDSLRAILADRRFASAERNARFLSYVVESALEGKTSEIKETVVATEVYGRANNYDPKADSIVRVEATRLRQKLRSYYENEGRHAPIRISLPSGSYVPQFERVEGLPEKVEPQSEPAPVITVSSLPDFQPPVPEPTSTFRLRPFALAATVGVAAVLLTIPIARGSRATIEPHDPDAIAAWKEGVALLSEDPHTGQTESGPPKTLLRAIERLEFAVARGPRFARAWATLSEAYDYASSYVGRDLAEDARRAEAAARNAIVYDDKLAAGHHMLGLVFKGVKWDFAQAEIAYRRALALDPHNSWAVIEYADLLWETGRVGQAAEEIRKARALLPAFPPLAVKEAEIQLNMGRPDAALATANSAIELNRTSLRAHVAAGVAHEMKGDIQQALERYEHVLAADPSDRRALPAYGYLLARSGQSARAREVLSRLEKMNSTVRNCAFQVAVVHAGLGEDKLALDWLERAWRTRQSHFPFASVEYRFRGLHSNPRFRELLNRVGLKPFPQ